MGPWSINPAWQNFSSLYRETCSAYEAKTEFEKAHHLTAALYFGISALEAFLNRQMRAHLSRLENEETIFKKLRNTRFLTKLDEWPKEISGNELSLEFSAIDLLHLANEVRGNLTHPKTLGHDIYEQLFSLTPSSILDAVAEYIVAFHEYKRERYPYWVFGWNYLNPRSNSYDIILLNEQQFCHSLANLGFSVSSFEYARSEAWQSDYLGSVRRYRIIRDTLGSLDHCEPKFDRFPFQPKLCRRWWTSEHQALCGHVTEVSIAAAKQLGQA